MTYPGNSQLSADAQQRVLSAFRRAITLLQAGNRREAMIALDFTLRLDPDFEPSRNLSNQLSTGSGEIDLGSMITDLGLPTEEEIQAKLVDAVDDFNERRLAEAREKVEAVLRELPGNQEARRLRTQIDHALETEAQIGELLSQAHQQLTEGKAGQAAELVMKAQAIDPAHPGIAPLLHQIQAAAPAAQPASVAPPAQPDQPQAASDEPQPVEFAFPAESDSGAHAEGGFDTLAEGAPLFEPEQIQTPTFELDESSGFEAGAPDASVTPTENRAASGEAAPIAPDDLADLFDEGAGTPGPATPAPPVPGGDDAGRIAELYRQGQGAFEREDYLEAIDIWSRIYLIDPDNAEAGAAIDEARKRQDEIDRAVEQKLFEAQEAADAGDTAKALGIAHEILAAHPDNLAAQQLVENLSRQGAPAGKPASASEQPEEVPPAPPAAPKAAGPADVDADLFDTTETGTAEPSPPEDLSETGAAAPPELPPQETIPSRRGPRPGGMRLILLGLGAVVIVAIGLWFGSKLMSGAHAGKAAGSADRVLAQAEALYKKGQPEKAIRLLEGFHASNMDQVRIARRLRIYKKALTPPTPTPPPEEAAKAQEAFTSGNWLEAYRLATQGLAQHPGDAGLSTLRTKILDEEKQIGPLIEAERQGDYETAVGIARELAVRYPKHPELKRELARDLFNLAVNDLRAYNLTGASNQLQALLKVNPADAEAHRILRFIAKYQVRPVDMQLKVFIGSLSYR